MEPTRPVSVKIPVMEAVVFETEDKCIVGGACEFYDDKNKEWVVLMLHMDHEDKPMVTRVKPESVKMISTEDKT